MECSSGTPHVKKRWRPPSLSSSPQILRYKAAGYHSADENGTLDETEFLDVAKDDVLAFPTPVHRTYPPLVADAMPSVLLPFMRKSLAINHVLLAVLNDKLGLEHGTLAALHCTEERSGCVARVIRTPPQIGKKPEVLERQALLGAHTDFGSLVSPPAHLSIAIVLRTHWIVMSRSSIIGWAVFRFLLRGPRIGSTSEYAHARMFV